MLATPKGFAEKRVFENFRERIAALSIKVIENEAWDCIGHASLVLAASGTVTMEAAVLGTPMVTFYKVTALSWWAGRRLVKVPYLSMVNLIAGRLIVPELIQDDMTAAKLASAASELSGVGKPAGADARGACWQFALRLVFLVRKVTHCIVQQSRLPPVWENFKAFGRQ